MSTVTDVIESSVGLEHTEDEKLFDYITKSEIQDTPENREAKVVIEERLHKEYGYDIDQMLPEFRVQKGSTLIGPADVVIFNDSKAKTQDNIFAIVECKRKDRSDGIEQLKTYLAGVESAQYGIWFNGDDIVYIRRLKKAPHWKLTYNIPRKGEPLGLPRKDSLKPATELVKVFESQTGVRFFQTIWGNTTCQVRNWETCMDTIEDRTKNAQHYAFMDKMSQDSVAEMIEQDKKYNTNTTKNG